MPHSGIIPSRSTKRVGCSHEFGYGPAHADSMAKVVGIASHNMFCEGVAVDANRCTLTAVSGHTFSTRLIQRRGRLILMANPQIRTAKTAVTPLTVAPRRSRNAHRGQPANIPTPALRSRRTSAVVATLPLPVRTLPVAVPDPLHFLVIDSRFGTPIYVFLEVDPRENKDYPGLNVREVAIERVPETGRGRIAIGRDPHQLNHFCEFLSDNATSGAGFILIEPRYVGPTWDSYNREFRPQGEKPQKRNMRSESSRT